MLCWRVEARPWLRALQHRQLLWPQSFQRPAVIHRVEVSEEGTTVSVQLAGLEDNGTSSLFVSSRLAPSCFVYTQTVSDALCLSCSVCLPACLRVSLCNTSGFHHTHTSSRSAYSPYRTLVSRFTRTAAGRLFSGLCPCCCQSHL